MHTENPKGRFKQRCTVDETCTVCLKITVIKYLASRFFLSHLLNISRLSYIVHTEFSLRTLAELWYHGDGCLGGDTSVLQGFD